MTPSRRLTLRAVLTSLASLPLAGTANVAADDAGVGRGRRASTLVACFSRSGNTRVVAGLIQRAAAADLFEIRTAIAYPDEYLATVEQARQERDRQVEPELAAKVANLARYDTIYLGFPIWGETAPPVIRSFLSAHDLAGKTLVPFVTHGGYGLGDSDAVIRRHAPKATWQPGFSMQADQERRTMDQVNDWLQAHPVQRHSR